MAKQSKTPRPACSIAPRIVRGADAIVALLKRRKLTLVTAESCTGGLIAAALSQAEGASDVLEGAFVTYTKGQKTRALGIPPEVLKKASGAVSADIARRMAVGAQKHARCSLSLSVTGVLGPAPDADGNPVGLVYLAVARGRRAVATVEKRFPRQSHDQLRCKVVEAAFALIAQVAKRRAR